MILSNVEIQRALDDGRLVIKPEPMPRRPTHGATCPYDTHTVDLTLSTDFVVPNSGPFTIDFAQPGKISEFIAQNSKREPSSAERPFVLGRGKFVLAQTRETVELPIKPKLKKCLAARIEGKSSRARCGLLVHFTAPTVHPGWSGPLTLEMANLGPADLTLKPGIAIAQLIVEEVLGIPFENQSQFHGQRTPSGTR
ncbi:MAG TPA: dCTP deaminase [Planctomycetota bacterium]|nr:dCTP deaminase [Planctomycetota bacterium]